MTKTLRLSLEAQRFFLRCLVLGRLFSVGRRPRFKCFLELFEAEGRERKAEIHLPVGLSGRQSRKEKGG